MTNPIDPPNAYPVVMRAMHWTTALLLVGSYVTAWMVSSTSSSTGVSQLILLHRSVGLVVCILTMVRFVWRRLSRVPDLPPDVPRIQRFAARTNELGLYAILVFQPLLGMTASMLHGDRIVLLGGIVLPNVLTVDRRLARVVFNVHGTVALVLLGSIGIHVAAALYHQFVRRDDVLAGMLPGLRRQHGGTAAKTVVPR